MKILCALKFLTLSAVLIFGAAVGREYYNHTHSPVEPMTLQRRAEHRIEYRAHDRATGYCTGTAIGPHALMTASHCNNERDKTDTFRLDNSPQDFHIENTLSDNRDHDVYLVDTQFTNWIPYVVRPAKFGEHVYLYGSGGAGYPPRRLDGTRISYDDPSDIDADDGQVRFSMPVIPGDSGSAVFNDDGTIAAVTTYLLRDPWMFDYLNDQTTLDFTPAFTPKQLADAESFAPTEYHPNKKKDDADSDDDELPSFLPPFFFK